MITQDRFDWAKSRMATKDDGFRAAYAFTVALQIAGVITTEMDGGGNATWIFADHINVGTRHQLLDMRNFLIDSTTRGADDESL